MKIGIMGGTFNPIHYGHLGIARAAYEELQLDEIWFIPTGTPYFKNQSEIAGSEDRLRMVEFSLLEFPYPARMLDLEIKKDKNTYTYETLEELKHAYPEHEFTFILGADSLGSLPRWRNPGRILELARLCVAARESQQMQDLNRLALEITEALGGEIIVLHCKELVVSSTEIRARVRQKASLEGLVPRKVIDYINERSLYV